MATNLSSCHNADEDYIDIEVSSSSKLFCCSDNTSPQSREFEFQMSFTSDGRESTTSPADELFYKGKLLPLYLPPRLQMVQTVFQGSTNTNSETKKEALEYEDEYCSIPFISSSTVPSTNTSTPLESCNISPSESCRVSCELNPAEYFFEWSTEFSSFINSNPKKSWSKKLKMIKQFSLTQKLKASRVYLKSLFSKSACSDESCAKAARNSEAEQVPQARDSSSKYIKVGKKTPFGHIGRGTYPTLASVINNIDIEGVEENINNHRRSFSGAIKRHSPSKCLSSSSSSSSSCSASSSSSSFSVRSNVPYELHSLKRSSSAASDIEISIESAIAHCKNSQQIFNSRNPLSDAGFYSLATSKIAPRENPEKAGIGIY